MRVHDRLWDVVVIGAGPAGAVAALGLASRGHDVLLVDRFPFPREKVCGDGLLPDALGCLRRAGVYERVLSVGQSVSEIAVFSPSQIEFRVPGELMTVKREALDDILRREAISSGAQFLSATVAELRVVDGGVSAVLNEVEDVRARFAVVATGANVALLQSLGMVERMKPSAAAIRCYVRSSFPLQHLVVSFDKSIVPGYGWIFPLRGGEFNVGCGVPYARGGQDLYAIYERFVTRFPLAKALLARQEASTTMKGHGLRYALRGSAPLGYDRVLAVGESVGATFPLTGEGIGKAMETSEKAAALLDEALTTGDVGVLKEYPEWLQRELRPKYLAYEIAEKFQSHWWLNDLLALRARRSPYLARAFSGILAETVDPRSVFCFRGLARSFWA